MMMIMIIINDYLYRVVLQCKSTVIKRVLSKIT